MDKIVKNLTDTTKVKIRLGKDDICSYCNSPDENVCSAAFVAKIDQKVMDLLNIKENDVVEFGYAMKILKSKMNPELHRKICKECIWMKKGYCKDTFRTYDEE